MEIHTLSFCTIIIRNPQLAEVIVTEGEAISETHVHEYHSFLLNNLSAPFSLLVNKIHPYTYTFEAQKIIGQLKEIKAMAIVAPTSGSLLSTKILLQVNKEVNDVIKIFNDRDQALNWLEQQ